MTSQCGNPAKVNDIEADPKDTGLKRSANFSAKWRTGLKCLNMEEAFILQWTPDGCQ